MTIDTRTGELIAVGAAIGANCVPCLEYHVGKARQEGADETDIAGAVEVGRAVRKGAAARMDGVAASLRSSEATAAPARGCCG